MSLHAVFSDRVRDVGPDRPRHLSLARRHAFLRKRLRRLSLHSQRNQTSKAVERSGKSGGVKINRYQAPSATFSKEVDDEDHPKVFALTALRLVPSFSNVVPPPTAKRLGPMVTTELPVDVQEAF